MQLDIECFEPAVKGKGRVVQDRAKKEQPLALTLSTFVLSTWLKPESLQDQNGEST